VEAVIVKTHSSPMTYNESRIFLMISQNLNIFKTCINSYEIIRGSSQPTVSSSLRCHFSVVWMSGMKV